MIGGDKYEDIKNFFDEWKGELEKIVKKIYKNIDDVTYQYLKSIKIENSTYVSEIKYKKEPFVIEDYTVELNNFIISKKDEYNYGYFMDKYTGIITKIREEFNTEIKKINKQYNKIVSDFKNSINDKYIPIELSGNEILRNIWERENNKILEIKRNNIDKNYMQLFYSVIDEINDILESINKSQDIIKLGDIDIDRIINSIYGNDLSTFTKKLVEDNKGVVKEAVSNNDKIVKLLIDFNNKTTKIMDEEKNIITTKYNELLKIYSIGNKLKERYDYRIRYIDEIYNDLLKSISNEKYYKLEIEVFKTLIEEYIEEFENNIKSVVNVWNTIDVSEIQQDIEVNKRFNIRTEKGFNDIKKIFMDKLNSEITQFETLQNEKFNENETSEKNNENKYFEELKSKLNIYITQDIDIENSDFKKYIEETIIERGYGYLLQNVIEYLNKQLKTGNNKEKYKLVKNYITEKFEKIKSDINTLISPNKNTDEIRNIKLDFDNFIEKKIVEIDTFDVISYSKIQFEEIINNIDKYISYISKKNINFNMYNSRLKKLKNKLIIKKLASYHLLVLYYKFIKENITDNTEYLEKMVNYCEENNIGIIDINDGGRRSITTFLNKLYNNIYLIKQILPNLEYFEDNTQNCFNKEYWNMIIDDDFSILKPGNSFSTYNSGYGGSKNSSIKKYKIIKKS